MTEPLLTPQELCDDMNDASEVFTKTVNVTIHDIQKDMAMFYTFVNKGMVAFVTDFIDIHSIVVKYDKNAYAYYDKTATIIDLYNVYKDLIDLENYTEGYLSIHEQNDKFQNDYMNDLIERAQKLLRNEDFPDTVPIFFDMDDETYETLLKMANEQNVTVDELVQKVVIDEINKIMEENK